MAFFWCSVRVNFPILKFTASLALISFLPSNRVNLSPVNLKYVNKLVNEEEKSTAKCLDTKQTNAAIRSDSL